MNIEVKFQYSIDILEEWLGAKLSEKDIAWIEDYLENDIPTMIFYHMRDSFNDRDENNEIEE